MNEVRQSLKNYIEHNALFAPIIPAGFVFILINPILSFISSLNYLKFYGMISVLLYVLYLVGILICIAESVDWALGTAFSILALKNLILLIRIPTFNYFIYTVFYICLAVLAFRELAGLQPIRTTVGVQSNWDRNNGFKDSQDRTGYGSAANAAVASGFCEVCGKPVDPSGQYCPYCGASYPKNTVKSDNKGKFVDYYVPNGHVVPAQNLTGPAGALASMCGSTLSLVFTIIFTASLAMNLIVNFSIINLLSQIPLIIICVGCWLIYAGCKNGNLNETGFTLISGSLLAKFILSVIPCGLGAILGFVVMVQGGDLVGIGLGILLGCILLVFLFGLYWEGLRKTAVSGRAILRGSGHDWQTSMFSIVLICIGTVFELISLTAVSTIYRVIDNYTSSLSYSLYMATGSSELADALSNALSSTSGNSEMATICAILSLATTVCGVIILIQIRNRNKMGLC